MQLLAEKTFSAPFESVSEMLSSLSPCVGDLLLPSSRSMYISLLGRL